MKGWQGRQVSALQDIPEQQIEPDDWKCGCRFQARGHPARLALQAGGDE